MQKQDLALLANYTDETLHAYTERMTNLLVFSVDAGFYVKEILFFFLFLFLFSFNSVLPLVMKFEFVSQMWVSCTTKE